MSADLIKANNFTQKTRDYDANKEAILLFLQITISTNVYIPGNIHYGTNLTNNRKLEVRVKEISRAVSL